MDYGEGTALVSGVAAATGFAFGFNERRSQYEAAETDATTTALNQREEGRSHTEDSGSLMPDKDHRPYAAGVTAFGYMAGGFPVDGEFGAGLISERRAAPAAAAALGYVSGVALADIVFDEADPEDVKEMLEDD